MLRNKKQGIVGAALIAATSLTLSALPADAAATTGTASKASGYSIKSNGKVTGGWVGTISLKIGTKSYGSVYMDPTKRPGKTYNGDKISFTSDIGGAYGGPSARSTARVAYILGKYSVGTPGKTTAAAVDLAVNTLLHSGTKYAYNKSVGKSRAKQTKHYTQVVRLTKRFLDESAKMSGPYQTVLRAAGTSGNINVRYSIKTISGRPVANKSVQFVVGTNAPTTVRTDSDGRVNLVLSQQTPGENTVTATAVDLYDWRVPVVPAVSSKDSNLVAAPARVSVKTTTVGKTTGDQLVTFNAVNPVILGTNVRGSVTVNGWDGDRTLTSNVYGPFATLAAANANNCTGTAAATASQVINADGTFKLAETASQVGYWRYGVAVSANSSNNAYAGCQTPFVVRSQAKLSVAREASSVALNKTALGKVTVSGLPDAAGHTVTVNLYGPFASSDNVSCSSSKLFKRVTLSVNKNGTFNTSRVTMNKAGYYGWSASINGSEFAQAGASTCPPPAGSRFRVVN